ncbi:MAG: FAD-dependent oxidoreductase, partial [Chloroflexi bacterium]|nr:FAD-dependent oxidoreductase [Chloroflexota bacterium]
CYLNPPLLMASLAKELQRRGVSIRWNTAVCGWKAGAIEIDSVLTTAGTLTADDYVVAAGAWTPQVLRAGGLPEADVRLPMQAGKGYSITMPAPHRQPAVCAILSEGRVAVTPVGQGLRFGGTLEVCGNDLSINRRRVEGMIRSIPKYLPDFRPGDFRGLTVWSGLRPCSPDGLPYVGRFGRFPNLIAAAGHAMMGVSLAPITGQVVAGMLGGEPPAVDLSLLSPDRFRKVRGAV